MPKLRWIMTDNNAGPDGQLAGFRYGDLLKKYGLNTKSTTKRLVDTVTRPSIAGLVNSIAAAPELYTVGSSYNSVIVAQASGLCEGFVTFGAASQLHLRRAEERQGGGGKVSRTLYLVPPSIDAHRLFSFAGMVKSAASLRITLWNNALSVRTKVEVPGSSKMFSPQKSKLSRIFFSTPTHAAQSIASTSKADENTTRPSPFMTSWLSSMRQRAVLGVDNTIDVFDLRSWYQGHRQGEVLDFHKIMSEAPKLPLNEEIPAMSIVGAIHSISFWEKDLGIDNSGQSRGTVDALNLNLLGAVLLISDPDDFKRSANFRK
ncbi:hypothetical protein PsYK624_138250 [Phanerochaete sordida]|uniref:Uncharacterized protein n=1 Tax=Phanerochaete sordida TaxID=48140 RepID=A0A9P3GNR8_9APHY|nr:hypothetical protein PsYK624_138250 [Phanerochaete sordida]